MEIFLILLACVVILVVDWMAASVMYEIAVMKGHYQKKYFWWCFLIAAFGYPMVIALPDRRSTSAQTQTVSTMDELPDL